MYFPCMFSLIPKVNLSYDDIPLDTMNYLQNKNDNNETN